MSIVRHIMCTNFLDYVQSLDYDFLMATKYYLHAYFKSRLVNSSDSMRWLDTVQNSGSSLFNKGSKLNYDK